LIKNIKFATSQDKEQPGINDNDDCFTMHFFQNAVLNTTIQQAQFSTFTSSN